MKKTTLITCNPSLSGIPHGLRQESGSARSEAGYKCGRHEQNE